MAHLEEPAATFFAGPRTNDSTKTSVLRTVHKIFVPIAGPNLYGLGTGSSASSERALSCPSWSMAVTA